MHLKKPTPGDVIAGISVALLALPQGLAYAELAGMPVYLLPGSPHYLQQSLLRLRIFRQVQ